MDEQKPLLQSYHSYSHITYKHTQYVHLPTYTHIPFILVDEFKQFCVWLTSPFRRGITKTHEFRQ